MASATRRSEPPVSIRQVPPTRRQRAIAAICGRVAPILAGAQRSRAELALSAAILGGWTLITVGLAALTTRHVWPISAGFFLLSLAGWQFVGRLFWRGLYILTRPAAKRNG